MNAARFGFIVLLALCGCERAHVLRLEAQVLELEERARKIELREEAYRRAAAQQDSALHEATRQLESARALRDAAKATHQRSLREAEEQRRGQVETAQRTIEKLERERATAQKTIAQQDKHVQASLLLKDENIKLKERLRELEAQLEAAGASRGE